MASDKLARVLRSKGPLPPDQVAALSDFDGGDWVYSNASPRKEKLLSVCFTGLSLMEKTELSESAGRARFRVVPSATASLAFLVSGETAGPVKLAKAENLSISLMTGSQFLHFVDTGQMLG